MKSGFVSLFGLPNAGKSSLLNTIMGEKLAIVSPKVQTTRHRIPAILNGDNYQIIFSDTPGIITPQYGLQTRMMKQVKNALLDSDLILLLVASNGDWQKSDDIFLELNLKKKSAIVIITKSDLANDEKIKEAKDFFNQKHYTRTCLATSVKRNFDKQKILKPILNNLPEGEPYYEITDDISPLPTKYFVAEIIREKIFEKLKEELPYHTTVFIKGYNEKQSLDKIVADIYVQRESQKKIVIGDNASMIKSIGTAARLDIEKFVGRKVFLELNVSVKPKWREDEKMLNELGYE